MECRLWRKKSNCTQINGTPSLKEEGETVVNLVLLEMSRDYKIKGKELYIITVLRCPSLMAEVRGRSQEDPMPEGQGPRGVTPTSEVRGGSRKELPHVRGQGQQPRGATPRPRSGAAAAL